MREKKAVFQIQRDKNPHSIKEIPLIRRVILTNNERDQKKTSKTNQNLRNSSNTKNRNCKIPSDDL